MKKTVLGIFVASFLVTGALTYSPSADAKWIRSTMWNCRTLTGVPKDVNYELINWSTTQSMQVRCSIDDSDYLPKANINTIRIHGFEGHLSVLLTARACVSYADVNGGACGAKAWDPNGFAPHRVVVSPPPTVWTTENLRHFGYIVVTVPPKQDERASKLSGYYLSE